MKSKITDNLYGLSGDLKPKRIQRKRIKGWRMPSNTIYVGRPTRWGNPYQITMWGEKQTRETAIRLFEDRVCRAGEFILMVKKYLKGSNLACWCGLDQPCHADILLKIANS